MAKILVVDDEKDALATIEAVLSSEGHEIILAEDGVQALESVSTHPPDIIVCDIEMPKLKGFDVLTELRKDPVTSKIPIIFLTGRTDIAALVQSMELNVNDFLTKPFTVQDLIAAVNIQLKKIVQEPHISVANLLSKPI
jgi:Response regulator containing CheY-like receiver, AAA-type ATPase, and DNA-binding domains